MSLKVVRLDKIRKQFFRNVILFMLVSKVMKLCVAKISKDFTESMKTNLEELQKVSQTAKFITC